MMRAALLCVVGLTGPALAQDDVCGAFYTLDDFVGTWQASVGSGVISDGAGSFAIQEPDSHDFTGPLYRIDETLFLESPEGTFELQIVDDAIAPDQWSFSDANLLTPEEMALTLGCDLGLVGAIGGTTRVTTPEGERVDIAITLLVVGQNADLDPDLLYGSFRWSGVDVRVGATRPMRMNRLAD